MLQVQTSGQDSYSSGLSAKQHSPPVAYKSVDIYHRGIVVTAESFHGFDLNYEALNQRLNRVKRDFGMRRAVSSHSLQGETRTFAEILDQEVENVVFYYLEIQGILAKQIRTVRERQIQALQDIGVTLDVIDEFCRRYREIGTEVLELLNYLERNSVALKKILLRHDLLFDQKMASIYFDTRLAGTSSRSAQLNQLYHQEGIRAIIDAIRRGFEELYDARRTLLDAESHGMAQSMQDRYVDHEEDDPFSRKRKKAIPRVPFRKRLASFTALHLLGARSADAAAADENSGLLSGKMKSTGSLFNMLHSTTTTARDEENNNSRFPHIIIRKRALSELEPVLRNIQDVSDRVTKAQSKSAMEFISTHSSIGLEFTMRDMNRAEQEEKGEVPTTPKIITSKIGLYLNLFVTFLYLANQYVVAPSSAKYADRLGMTPSMSGMIIGFAPAAALISSLIYSTWSNHSFKHPLLVGIVCGIVGNVFYGAALQCDSTAILFLGRLLTGFGGTRVISRRYIADHISLEDRLVASSEFVTAGAMGYACGPLIASLIERSNFSFTWYGYNNQVWLQFEAVTAPGWIMALLWSIALVAVFCFFEDPLQNKAEESSKSSGKDGSERGNSESPYNGTLPSEDIVCVESGNELWADDDSTAIELKPHPVKKPPIQEYHTMSDCPELAHEYHYQQPASNLQHSRSPWKEMDPVLRSYQFMSDHRRHEPAREPRCWDHITIEVYVILLISMVNKAGQELSVACMPFIMKQVFQWDSEGIGYFMALIGGLVMPTNLAVNYFAKETEERTMILRLSYISIVGICIVCQFGVLGHYTVLQYLLGTAIIFTSLNSLEGVIMSLLSKLISPELAKGTFNSGLLATEAGTFGRMMGDMAITAFGAVPGTSTVVNQLYFPLAVMLAVTVAAVNRYYDQLED